MKYQSLKITIEQAVQIADTNYGIKVEATVLPGEIDFNFRVKTTEGTMYVLKISRPDENEQYLDFQQQLLAYISKTSRVNAPKVIKDKNDNLISTFIDTNGQKRSVRLLSWISGRVWSSVNPQLDALRYSLGEECGALTAALQGFEHPLAKRTFEWDIAQAQWTLEYQDIFEGDEQQIIKQFYKQFEAQQVTYQQLRKTVVHNDANDNNVIVSEDLIAPRVIAAIDYGDAIHTQIINDVAISCAYTIMGHQNPLEAALPIVKGYHQNFPLKEKELEHLYIAIAMRLVISVTKSAINKKKEPDNEYLLISEQPAWQVLRKWSQINPQFAHYSFRKACGYRSHPNEEVFKKWAETNTVSIATIFPTIAVDTFYPIDLSVESTWLGNATAFEDIEWMQFKLNRLQKEQPKSILAGGYLEARPFYTTDAYKIEGNSGAEHRTIHLGMDFWVPSDTPLHAPFAGTVYAVHNNNKHKDYGPTIILKHDLENGESFYTLYGHLSIQSLSTVSKGESIQKGQLIGYIGTPEENVGWNPHLHFQIMLDLLGNTVDFPGVCTPRTQTIWSSICPDPNMLFQSQTLANSQKVTNDDLIRYRKRHLGKSLSLQYKTPIKMVRGEGVHLIDQWGQKYLDTVNNVAHVGHEHPKVVKAGQNQMGLLNTNSRYLHENINALTKELIETLPSKLNVLHFVNSGSEANELAIRMVKAVTGQKDIIASEIGYHGNSNACIDISSYKFDGKGGTGAPKHTHIFSLPDTFRGKYMGEDASQKYAEEVLSLIENIKAEGRNVGAIIIESIISCGGQIELPEGFLKQVYDYIRKEGGLCIADEVQVGCGRLGVWWGFQLHNVVPDIVTIGKPLGNGHPLAAVACTQEVADKFANGMEYFNTFGGNPVSCAIGKSVIQVVKEEGLMQNANEVGDYLKTKLKKLSRTYPILGDIRGQGLFLGIELVDEKKKPLPLVADYLINRMKAHGILMSTDGPDHNVLKIKPPMVFTKTHAEELIRYLEKILKEDMISNCNNEVKKTLENKKSFVI